MPYILRQGHDVAILIRRGGQKHLTINKCKTDSNGEGFREALTEFKPNFVVHLAAHFGSERQFGDVGALIKANIIARKRNFDYLFQQLKSLENIFVLPKTTTNSEASWFCFPMTIRSSTGMDRVELLKFLAKHKIHSRLLFAGNLIRQPYMATRKYRVNGSLDNADLVMNQTFWLGLYLALL